jgi:D-glycero-D-manno-heptose 1,7-bisphosphate phosphatase
MARMVILDRDGVINEDSDDYIKSAEEWVPIKGSLEAISRLKKAGCLVTVVSNQSGLARGLFDQAALDSMHDKMSSLLAQRGVELDGIYYCPHGPNENCLCRKPKPGLLLEIAKTFDINLKDTWYVGDKMTDVQAAKMAGARPALVKTGKGMRTLDKYGPLDDVPVYENLVSFVREYLKANEAG